MTTTTKKPIDGAKRMPPSAMAASATRDQTVSRVLARALEAARAGDTRTAEGLIDQVVNSDAKSGSASRVAQSKLIDAMRKRFGLVNATTTVPPVRTKVSDGSTAPLHGVSVVTCCMNRTENLLKAVPTWLAHKRVSEVVVVDWASTVPVAESLAAAGIRDSRIRVVRVNNEPRWILSFAFNLGFRMARHELILKLDADITLRPDFFDRNKLTGGLFIAGDWQAAAKGQEHINGFFFVHLVDLLRIKGFNEYITTYGWDDDDIYARLTQSGIRRVCVDTESIYHIPHDDAQRLGGAAQAPVNALAQLHNDTLFKIRANRYLAMVMPPWNKDRQFAPFSILQDEGRVATVRRDLSELPHVVSDDIRRDAEFYAALELVSWRAGPQAYHVPKDRFMKLLESKRLDEIGTADIAIAANLRADEDTLDRATSFTESGPPIQPSTRRRRRLYIDAQHGLGNRLRAFASAAAIARRTDREIVLLWTPDHHCDCRFADLFEQDIAVIESPDQVPRSGIRRYSYMEIEPGARKDEPIELNTDDDVLVRSAYVLKHAASVWSDENAELRALRPVTQVAELVASVRVDGCIAAHVRMEAGKGLDHNSYDSVENWSPQSHKEIQFWRAKSNYSAFIKRIDQLFADDPKRCLFLATDLPENYDVFRRYYGERLKYLPRRVFDRSREQLVFALADALLLSRCEMMLGSTWSSFSELAMRMSTRFSKIEMSGKDF